MKQPILTQQLVEAINSGCGAYTFNGAPCDISLKCRIAVFESPENMQLAYDTRRTSQGKSFEEEQFQELCSYVSHAQEGGISHLILHARPAVLTGLSPTKNRLVPTIDYETVHKIAQEFPALQVTLNGGITSMDALDRLTRAGENAGIGSYMAGRWMLQCPLSLTLIENMAAVGCSGDITEALERYMQYVERHLGQKSHTLAELCLPLFLVIEHLRDIFDEGCDNDNVGSLIGSEVKLYDAMKDNIYHLSALIPGQRKTKTLPDEINWKRLSASLKGFVGTKVYSKWKRNRSEIR
jgi:tRNA-dihydrouridine synthase